MNSITCQYKKEEHPARVVVKRIEIQGDRGHQVDTEQIPTGDTERHTDNRRYQSTTDNCRYQAVSDTDRTTRPNNALFTCERHKLIKTVLFPLPQRWPSGILLGQSAVTLALKKRKILRLLQHFLDISLV